MCFLDYKMFYHALSSGRGREKQAKKLFSIPHMLQALLFR